MKYRRLMPQAIAQAKRAVIDGRASGDLYLPLHLKNGIFCLKAYTSWMRNFGPAQLFQKAIPVWNTMQPSGNFLMADARYNGNANAPNTAAFASLSKKEYGRREAVKIALDSAALAGVHDIAITVFKWDSLQQSASAVWGFEKV